MARLVAGFPDADDLNHVGALIVEFDLVDGRVESVVARRRTAPQVEVG